MKKFVSILLIALLSILTFSACGKDTATTSGSATTSSSATTAQAVSAGKRHVEIKVKNYGTISVELDTSAAPITVANFIDLAKSGFYDGLTFHRIINGFMIQGGDPLGTGMGGSDKTIKGEFSANGINNPLSLTRGAIAMARLSNDMDSATSQFFIVQQDYSSQNGQYAGFGYVTSGMDIVDKICAETPVQDSNGTVNKEDQPVIESVKVLD